MDALCMKIALISDIILALSNKNCQIYEENHEVKRILINYWPNNV